MKSKDLYFISLGGLHVFIFFKLLDFSKQLISTRDVFGKQSFVILFGLFASITIFLLSHNLARIIQLLTVDDKEIYPKIVPIAQMTVMVLSFLLISTMIQNFILFR